MRRKGELTRAQIDRQFPYQVALPEAEAVRQFIEIQTFCQPLSICSRSFSVHHDDVRYQVRCFAEEQDAEAFRQAFDGIPFDPADHGKGNQWHIWTPKTPPRVP